MKTEGLYKEGSIKIEDFARKMGIPVRHLSETVNRIQGIGFSQYLNTYRIFYEP